MGYLGDEDWTKKVGDLGDWATNKVGDRRFGSKMEAGTGILGKYALGAGRLTEKSGRLGDSDLPPIEGLNNVHPD